MPAWTRALGELRRGNLRVTELHSSTAAVGAYRAFRRGMERLGFHVVVKTFYSPIPDVRTLPPSTWDRPSELAGVRFELEEQLAFLEGDLAPHLAEFKPPPGFSLDNPSYGPGDAELLYAMVRFAKPRRVVELGSGHTTLLIAAACVANERDGVPARFTAFDPFSSLVTSGLPGLSEVHPTRAQDVPLAVFDELGSGDALVVDTTHTVKTGGDVNTIVLDVLPRLSPGVLVHFHDVFLPWEYPRRWLEELGLFWAEQYLLQAFLAFNSEFEVLCALHALSRAFPARVAGVIPSVARGAAPAAFWIRRVDGQREAVR